MTHDAVITTLLRYAVSLVGSCLRADLFKQVDTMIANVAARKIGGSRRSARIESLHFLSEASTMSNLFVVHCVGRHI